VIAPKPVELLASGLISRAGHLVEVQDLRLPGAGRVLKVRIFDGLDVEVLPDRGLDIGSVWFRGRPISWSSPVTDRARLASPTGTQWLTRFNGGLVTTCGLENVGPATAGYGLHGTHSHHVASDVSWHSEVTDDGAKVTISGTISSVELFGRRIYVYREITIRVPADEQPYLSIRDRVRNEGVVPAVTSLLYHINFGAPAILPGTRIHVDATGVGLREPCPEVPSASYLPEPTEVMTEAVFEYSGVRAVDGVAIAVISTPSMERDIEVSWSQGTLPRLCQWVFPTRGGWALGLEPGNAPMFGPDRSGEYEGAPLLAPGQEFEAEVRVRILAS
jgi:hypothetical protein